MTADTLNAQLGIGEETTYGTGVTPTRFIEFDSFQPKKEKTRILSKGMRAGTGIVPAKNSPDGSTKVSGSLSLEGQTKGLGLVLKHIFGSVATTQPDVGGSPTVYDHTFIPAGVAGKSLTLEGAFLDDAGSPHNMTAKGCKFGQAQFTVKSDELQMIELDVDAQNLVTADTKTAASYASAIRYYGSAGVSLSIAGSSIVAEDATLTLNNQLDSKNYLGNAGLQSAPSTLQRLGLTAEVNMPWSSWAAYNRLDSDADVALVITCLGPLIHDIYSYMLQFTMNVETIGDTPELTGASRVDQPLKFNCTGDTPGEACTAVYRTTDSTP